MLAFLFALVADLLFDVYAIARGSSTSRKNARLGVRGRGRVAKYSVSGRVTRGEAEGAVGALC